MGGGGCAGAACMHASALRSAVPDSGSLQSRLTDSAPCPQPALSPFVLTHLQVHLVDHLPPLLVSAPACPKQRISTGGSAAITAVYLQPALLRPLPCPAATQSPLPELALTPVVHLSLQHLGHDSGLPCGRSPAADQVRDRGFRPGVDAAQAGCQHALRMCCAGAVNRGWPAGPRTASLKRTVLLVWRRPALVGLLAVTTVLLMDTGEWRTKGKREKAGTSPCIARCTHASVTVLTHHCFAPVPRFSCLPCSAWLAAANTYLFYNDIPGLTGGWVGGWVGGQDRGGL